MVNQIEEIGNEAASTGLSAFTYGEEQLINIDSQLFTDSLDFAIRTRQFRKTLIQIGNTGSFDLVYSINATLDFSEDTPNFITSNYKLLANGTGTISSSDNQFFETDAQYSWIIIRLRSATVDSTTGYIRMAGSF